MFKKMMIIFCLCLVPFLCSAQSNQNEELAIKNSIAQFVQAWNAHDPKAMAAVWTQDGDLLDPWGKWLHRRTGIEAFFAEEQAGKMRQSRMEQKVVNIQFLTPSLALVDVEGQLTGILSNGKEEPPFKHHVVFIAKKEDGKWLFIAARPYQFAESKK